MRCSDGLRVRPDVVFTRAKVVVFVDGCFWHGCPDHGRIPGRNQAYWVPKLERNAKRDLCNAVALRGDGWHVERVWEHEDMQTAADRIVAMVTAVRGKTDQASRS
jgi:DNA mismatch endonuclease, patch repair protein